jgi:Hint module
MPRQSVTLAVALALVACGAARPLAAVARHAEHDHGTTAPSSTVVDHSQHSPGEHAAFMTTVAPGETTVDHSKHSPEEHAKYTTTVAPGVGDGVAPNATGPAADASAEGSDAEATRAAATGEAKVNDGACFPADAILLLESGETKRMDELAVGDSVHIGNGEYSRIFMFTHKAADHAGQYVQLTTASGAVLRATASHFLLANGVLVSAGAVAVGDTLERAADGADDRVVAVAWVKGTGLYNPQTLHGDVAVDGIVASTYTTAVEPRIAHAVLAPARAVYEMFGWYSALFEQGSRLAGAVPGGAVVF